MIITINRRKFIKTAAVFLLVLAALWVCFVGLLKVAYPEKYKEHVFYYAHEYELDPYLVFSIMKSESGFDKNAASHKSAIGLMQITEETAEWIASKTGEQEYDLADPETNIRFSCWYLQHLAETFSGDWRVMLAAYNAGSGNVSKWLADPRYSKDGKTLDEIPFGETKRYVNRVFNNYKIYIKLY